MDMVKKMPGTSLLVTFILGLIIGLVVLGWWLFPVEYTGINTRRTLPGIPGDLRPQYGRTLFF